MKPLVSVNLTTYNRAHLLPRALDSILAQTYPRIGGFSNTLPPSASYQVGQQTLKTGNLTYERQA